MKLTNIFYRPQLASLFHESDTSLTLGLQDVETGEVRRVVVSADMVATAPSEAFLSISVDDERNDVDLAAWWTAGDEGHAGYLPLRQ